MAQRVLLTQRRSKCDLGDTTRKKESRWTSGQVQWYLVWIFAEVPLGAGPLASSWLLWITEKNVGLQSRRSQQRFQEYVIITIIYCIHRTAPGIEATRYAGQYLGLLCQVNKPSHNSRHQNPQLPTHIYSVRSLRQIPFGPPQKINSSSITCHHNHKRTSGLSGPSHPPSRIHWEFAMACHLSFSILFSQTPGSITRNMLAV